MSNVKGITKVEAVLIPPRDKKSKVFEQRSWLVTLVLSGPLFANFNDQNALIIFSACKYRKDAEEDLVVVRQQIKAGRPLTGALLRSDALHRKAKA
jgi:hypothetical protein